VQLRLPVVGRPIIELRDHHTVEMECLDGSSKRPSDLPRQAPPVADADSKIVFTELKMPVSGEGEFDFAAGLTLCDRGDLDGSGHGFSVGGGSHRGNEIEPIRDRGRNGLSQFSHDC
jgi:hypothetical protein